MGLIGRELVPGGWTVAWFALWAYVVVVMLVVR